MRLESKNRIQAYRTSLRSGCFISLPFCRTWVALKSSGTLNAREGEEGERAGLALVTPSWFSEIQRQALDDKRPVGRSVGRLGPVQAHSSAGTLLTPQRRHMRGTLAAEKAAVGLGAPSIPGIAVLVTDPRFHARQRNRL